MSDILDDYREWADEHLQQHVSTHSDRCHLWHDRCMIHRLAAALESARLTDAEREAVEFFGTMQWPRESQQIKARAATLRGLLERFSEWRDG